MPRECRFRMTPLMAHAKAQRRKGGAGPEPLMHTDSTWIHTDAIRVYLMSICVHLWFLPGVHLISFEIGDSSNGFRFHLLAELAPPSLDCTRVSFGGSCVAHAVASRRIRIVLATTDFINGLLSRIVLAATGFFDGRLRRICDRVRARARVRVRAQARTVRNGICVGASG